METLNHHFAGHAKARAIFSRNFVHRDMRSGAPRFSRSWALLTFPFKPTAKRARELVIATVMPNSSMSRDAWRLPVEVDDRESRLIPRIRILSVAKRMLVRSIDRMGSRWRSKRMTFLTRRWESPSRSVCIISIPTKLGFPWASGAMQLNSLSRRSGVGGSKLGRQRYNHPQRLLITADSGRSNGHRNRLGKCELYSIAI